MISIINLNKREEKFIEQEAVAIRIISMSKGNIYTLFSLLLLFEVKRERFRLYVRKLFTIDKHFLSTEIE